MNKKYFGTDGIRGKVGGSTINPAFILHLGWAVGMVLGHRGKVLIGKDTRISGYMLESALEAGLSAAGVNIYLLGPMPTPAIAYLTRTLHANAGVVISASHNGYEDNGIKFFNQHGMKLGDDIELAIEAQLMEPMQVVPSAKLGKASRLVDAPGRYVEFCKNSVGLNLSLRGLKIVLDCANGATYHVAPSVFTELDATVIDISVEPDGFNINDGCGSTAPAHLQKAVLRAQADMGIAFDGDGDRVIMVDHRGEVIDGDEILFIIAKYHQAIHQLQGGVVGTVMSNLGLELSLRDLGIDFARSQVGDRHVLEQMQRLGWSLGGESSGHILCLQKATTGDGVVSALQVLAAMEYFAQDLHQIKKGMQRLPQTMINIPYRETYHQLLETPHVKSVLLEIENQLQEKGRVLLRRSGTESVVRIMVQGEDEILVQEAAEQLADAIRLASNMI